MGLGPPGLSQMNHSQHTRRRCSSSLDETLTVCLLFAQFWYVNPIWNYKNISYSYLILNKCMGIIKMVKICQKVKISKKWPIFLVLTILLPILVPFWKSWSQIWKDNSFVNLEWVYIWKLSKKITSSEILKKKVF